MCSCFLFCFFYICMHVLTLYWHQLCSCCVHVRLFLSIFLRIHLHVCVRLYLPVSVSLRVCTCLYVCSHQTHSQLSGPRRSGVWRRAAAPLLLQASRGRRSARWSAWPCCSGWSPCRSGPSSWHPGQRSRPPERLEYTACAAKGGENSEVTS